MEGYGAVSPRNLYKLGFRLLKLIGLFFSRWRCVSLVSNWCFLFHILWRSSHVRWEERVAVGVCQTKTFTRDTVM